MASALMHINLTQLNNDGVIGMESEQAYNRDPFDRNFSSDMGPVKRDHDDELNRSQVKKRRKQSKPIRIASTESHTEETDGLRRVERTSEDHMGSDQHSQNDNKSCKNESDGECFVEENGNESFLSESDVKKESPCPLNLSHTKSPSPKESVDSLPTTSLEEKSWCKTQDSVVSSLYPLSSLDHSNLKSQAYPYNLLLSSQSTSLVPPGFKRIFVGNNESQIGSPQRIFNPEAFCDLCNKEFCNKYFLKTHKANKHGIYTDNVTPNNMENIPSLPILTYFSNHLSNIPVPTNHLNKKTCPNFGNGSSKSSSSSMRAFCNICQREFCNKYFVRRHKAKIHGIIENPEGNSQEYKYPMTSMAEKHDEFGQPGPSSGKLSEIATSSQKEVQENMLDDEKCKIHKEPDTESEVSDSPQNQLGFHASPWHSDDGKDNSRSPDRPKKLTTSNSNVFCEICGKEYFNQHFLKIHKEKCRGISSGDKEDKPKEAGNFGNMWKSYQPTPLNLILRENNQILRDNEGGISCSQCEMTFPDHYLLRIHCNLAHTVKIEDAQVKTNDCLPCPTIESDKGNSELTNSLALETPPKIVQESETNDSKYYGSDVQRLHSMIMKLNQQNQLESFFCDVCNKDFGKSSALENHIIKEHTALLEEMSNGFYEDNQNPQLSFNKWECTKCPSTFQNSNLLDLHLNEKHSVFAQKFSDKNVDENIELGSHLSASSERSVPHTPTSSFCEICKKELCNKYFMKTHMQRMHGISIENGAHIGGVVCDICNKELCSKYFLRVHKQNSHGIVEEAFLPQIGSEIKGQIQNSDVALKPSDNELSHRYFSHFTEVCSICARRFRSVKWLKTHLLNDHGEEGKEKWRELQQQNGNKTEKLTSEGIKKSDNYCFSNYKNSPGAEPKANEPGTSYQQCEVITSLLNKNPPSKNYQCSYCAFSTQVLSLLFAHERSHFQNHNESPEFRAALSESPQESHNRNELNVNAYQTMNCFPDTDHASYNSNFEFPSNQNEKDSMTQDDNNFSSKDQKLCKMEETGIRCLKCPYTAQQLDLFFEHMQKEHKCEDSGTFLHIVRDALLHLASTSLVPASFAVPSSLSSKFTMQPFVVEDKSNSTFVSSVVFLPVKEKLSTPVTASFRLTPT